jgi:hypothetical protein
VVEVNKAAEILEDVHGIGKKMWIAEKDAENATRFGLGHDGNTTATTDGDTDEGSTEQPAGLLERVDVLPSWRGERKRPEAQVLERSDGERLFPAGIGYIFGDSGDGKSWLILIAAWMLMRRRLNVVWVSYEDPNEDDIVDRLRYIGATEDDLEHLHLFTPSEPLTALVGELARYCRQHDARLFVLDSVGEANAVEGINEDSDAEWGQWARATLRFLYDLAIDADWDNAQGTAPCTSLTEIPIDHSTKSKDNPHFPSGTKRKRAMVTGLMVSVNVRQALAKNCVGRVQLVCSKDRTGRFRRGEVIAEVVIDATVQPYAISIEAPVAGQEMSTAKRRNATDRVLEVLNNTAKALTATEVHRIVNSDTNRHPGEAELAERTVGNTLTKLTDIERHNEPTGVGSGYSVRYSMGGRAA